MANHIESASVEFRWRPLLDRYHVVCHQTVSLRMRSRRIRSFRSHFFQNENAHPEHIHQYAMNTGGRSKFLFQNFLNRSINSVVRRLVRNKGCLSVRLFREGVQESPDHASPLRRRGRSDRSVQSPLSDHPLSGCGNRSVRSCQ